jgi:hypothetical protein
MQRFKFISFSFIFCMALSACGMDIESESQLAIREAVSREGISSECSCAMTVSGVVSSDYVAHANELIRIDMRGKMSSDVVTIRLPISDASNIGMPIEIATVNSGGAEDGSIVRIESEWQTIYPTIYSSLDVTNSEIMTRLVSTGEGWIVTGLH